MTAGRSRPIRFATGPGLLGDAERLLAAARRAEELGYSTFGMADHFMMPFAPLVALQAVAGVTSRLRLGQMVLNQDFRHPAVLAKELATLDVLSNGRLEVGIGAGWMRAEYEQAGIPFDGAAERIARLEETVVILKGLFAEGPLTFEGRHFAVRDLDGLPKPQQRPRPPIMIGGGGPKVLAVAARHADIVQVLPGPVGGTGRVDVSRLSAEGYQERLAWVRDAAGARFPDIELAVQLLNVTITDDTERAAADLASRVAPDPQGADGGADVARALLASPVVAIGSLGQVCDKLLQTRDALGFSYFAAPIGGHPKALGPVLERLNGQ